MLTACFGFEDATSEALRATMREGREDGQSGGVEVEHFRCGLKGLGAFGPVGCLGDAVNLVLAMQNEAQPEDVSEVALVSALERMKSALDEPSELRSLWVPTHLAHDCETDDTLSWLLLERVRLLRGEGAPKVLVQLPRTRGSTRLHHLHPRVACLPGRGFEERRAVLKNVAHMS